MTTPTTGDIAACLTTLTPVDDDGTDAGWEAPCLGITGGQVFGGQLLGQAVAVASRLDPELPVRSLQAVFPRHLADTGSVIFRVTVLHHGRAFAMQRITVTQPGRDGAPSVGFSANVICARPVEGIDHGRPLPEGAGTPERARHADLGLIPWETRIVGDTDLGARTAQPGGLLLWSRADAVAPDEPATHRALLAFATDLPFIGTALLPHEGWSQLDAHRTLRTGVISHQIVFHRPFRMDDWLLLSHTSPAAADGSAFGAGAVHAADGAMVASVSQESMIQVDSRSGA